ncbi:hypothetical protein QQ020_07695 [Fulvivirgaceae bacterium BMA12]|uniref:Uncharacterized protein n=1 Tax=Agaribacillus aureus TaxID=3051825 RepID=A0ABT8L2F3_9BACT|nr:hypothetical protein [Fulvivirgaceae bacterium BMA12]
MNLSEENRTTLLTHLHKSVEEAANIMANHLNNGRTNQLIDYPPNGGLTEEEKESLQQLKNNNTLTDALRKVFASNSASVLFELFNIIDGTGDPDPGTGDWSEITLVDMPEDFDQHVEFLHDNFYETYQNWRNKRKADFKLDLLDD